jgi:hypothetical protein
MLLFVIYFKIIDLKVSLKYEIEEPSPLTMNNEYLGLVYKMMIWWLYICAILTVVEFVKGVLLVKLNKSYAFFLPLSLFVFGFSLSGVIHDVFLFQDNLKMISEFDHVLRNVIATKVSFSAYFFLGVLISLLLRKSLPQEQ